MSESLLRVVSSNGGCVAVEGHPWQREKLKPVGIAALTAGILCARHNEALSGLDAVIGRFASAAVDGLRLVLGPAVASDAHSIHVFRGEDIERWMMKLLIGAIKAGYAPTIDRTTWTAPLSWLRYLFGDLELPPERGLFLPELDSRTRDEGRLPPRSTSFYLRVETIAGDPQMPILRVWIAGLDLLFIPPFSGSIVLDGPKRLVPRPGEIRLVNGQRYVALLFGWGTHGLHSTKSCVVKLDPWDVRLEDMPAERRGA